MKTFSSTDLALQLSLELGRPEMEVRAMLERAADAMTQQLMRGNSVELPGFLTMNVPQGPPAPATSQAGGTLELPARRQLQLEIHEELRKAVEGPERFQILLVIRRKMFFTTALASHLSSERSEVAFAVGEEATLHYLMSNRPDVIVVDAGIGRTAGICERVKRNHETSLVPILTFGEAEYSPKKTDGLAVLPDRHVKVASVHSLPDVVKAVVSALSQSVEARNRSGHLLRFRLQTRDDCLEKANELIQTALQCSGLSNEARDSVLTAFREALNNAARHGNKNNETADIEVEYSLNHEQVAITICDEGEGFDAELYLRRSANCSPLEVARISNQPEQSGSGLGIMLMRRCVDQLDYNYAGNKITLTRLLRAPAAPERPPRRSASDAGERGGPKVEEGEVPNFRLVTAAAPTELERPRRRRGEREISA